MNSNVSERWEVIPETDGRYSVSCLGRVRANWADVPRRNLKKRIRIEKSYFLKPIKNTSGYFRVALGRGKARYIHRLVAQAFLSNPDNLPQVDHIDGDRLNNSAENLRWITAKDNVIYGGHRHGFNPQRIASKRRSIHAARKEQYKEMLKQGASLRGIAKAFGTSHSSIRWAIKD